MNNQQEKHTPGPWQYHDEVSDAVYGADNRIVALMAQGRSKRDRKANARLIKEAPAMLDALERLLTLRDDSPLWIHRDVWDRARAAIKAAKGEV